MVRRLDRQGDVLIWCRKCSGIARQRMGPTLMNCCKPEQVGTKKYGKMLKRIQTLEDARIPAKEARNWKIEGQKRRRARKEYRRLWDEFGMRGFMAQKGLWNVAREKILQDRGAWYKAMHEDNYLSSWLREDLVGKKKERTENKREKKEGKKREEERVVARRRCVNPFSGEAFEESSSVEDSDSCGNSWGVLLGDSCGLSERVPEVSSGVLVVTDVTDSHSSLVVMGEASLSDSD